MYFRATLCWGLCLLSMPLWAFSLVIETQVKTTTWNRDGHLVVAVTHYHFGTDKHHQEGFLDGKGRLYAGTDRSILDADAALKQIEYGGPTGYGLISFLEHAHRVVCIISGHINLADIDDGNFVSWDPRGLRCAPDEHGDTERPAFIGLAHELAHISDVWKGTVNRETWKMMEDEEGNLIRVPFAELYATRMENKIRAENGIPLRMSYATAGPDGDRDLGSLLIRPGTRESLYYDSAGRTEYRPLRRREVAEHY